MPEKEKTTEQLLKEQYGEKLEEYKKQYSPRKLSVINVEGKLAILRPVTAAEMGQYSIMMAHDGLDVACRYLLEALWIDGDNSLRDDEEYFISAMLHIQNVIELKKSSFLRL